MAWMRSFLPCFFVVAVLSFVCGCNLFDTTPRPATPEPGADCPINGETYQDLECRQGKWRAESTTPGNGVATSGGATPAGGVLESDTYELNGQLAPSAGSHRAQSQTYEVELKPIIATSE